MYCSKCGEENIEGARFCMHCGADLNGYKVEISPKIEVSPKIDVSLDIEKLRDLKIPDKEEAIVEIVKEFNETLRTIGISASFDSGKGLDLTPFQKEVATIVEDKVEEALDKFKKPTGDPMTYIRLGVFEGYLENYEKAIGYCKKAIELDFNSIAAWAVMGDCFERMGEHEKALKCYGAVSMIKPPNKDKKEFDSNTRLAWAVKGYHYGEIGEYENALECFDKILETNPKAAVWDRKGIALGELGRHEEAISSFDKALELNPKRGDIWILKGVVFRVLKKYDDAIECFEKALEINPEDADAWKVRGITLRLLSGLKWREYQDADGYWLEINKVYEYQELLEKTLASFEKAAKLNPKDDDISEKVKEIREKLEGLSTSLAAIRSGDVNTNWTKIISYLQKWYEELSKEELFDFFRELPREVETFYYAPDRERPERFLGWLLSYVIPPLEDYYYSRKGHYILLNNDSLRGFIKKVVDDEYQREELLETLPYMDKDERIKLLKNLAKRLLEKE